MMKTDSNRFGQLVAVIYMVFTDGDYIPREIQNHRICMDKALYLKLYFCDGFIFKDYVRELLPDSKRFESLALQPVDMDGASEGVRYMADVIGCKEEELHDKLRERIERDVPWLYTESAVQLIRRSRGEQP